MKKIISLLLFITTASSVFAQTSSPNGDTSIWDNPMITFYVVAGFLFVTGILVLLSAFYMLKVIRILTRQSAEERAKKLGIEYKPEPTIWENIWQKSNDFVPMEKEKDLLMAHSYDGIQELDNHLPPWWTGLFYITIVFAVVYLFVFHIFDTLPLQKGEYENEVAYAKEQAAKNQAASPVVAIDENNVGVVTDAKALAEGKQIFLNNCSSCHRKDAGGDIGPNLTDEYWIHGGSVNDIYKTIKHGAPGTNMIAWEALVSAEKMKNVANYILTLQGSNPASPKKPQGNLYKPEVKVEQKTDSVTTAK